MINECLTERDVAIDAVRAAAKVCQDVHQSLVTADTLEKKDRSPVTVADFASQAIVSAMLAGPLPDDVIVGEEQADELRADEQAAIRASVTQHVASALPDASPNESQVLDWIDRGGTSEATGGRYWTVDPIDGTKGFLRGGQYAIALALLEDHQVVLGVIGCPNLPHQSGQGALLVAAKGHGAMLMPLDGSGREGTEVRVSDTADASAARFCESVESGHSSHDDAAKIAALLGITADPVRMDSQAKYASVARGDAQIYLRLPTRADYREAIWDHAAGMIVVTEAGGQVTDVHGRTLDLSHGRRLEENQGIIATNATLHDQVVAAVQKTINP